MNARRVALYTAVVVAVIVFFYVLYLIRSVLVLIFISMLLATGVAPLVDRLRSRISLGQAVLAIYMAFALGLGIFTYFLVRLLVEQVGTLGSNLPDILGALESHAGTIAVPVVREMALELLKEISTAVGPREAGVPAGVAQGVFNVTISLASLGFAFFSILVIAYYLTVDRNKIMDLIVSLFPEERRVLAHHIWLEVELRLGAWVRGQLILMGLMAAISAIGYTAMGLRYALLLAVVAGLTEMIPLVGPWIGTAPAVLVALTQDFWLAVAVMLFAMIIQTIEGNILVPRVMGSVVGINPLIVIIALLVGMAVMGIPGALLAVPVASVAYVLVQTLVLEHPVVLEEPVADKSETS